jgi:hypothetical protein
MALAERAVVTALFIPMQLLVIRGSNAASPAGLSAQPGSHYLHKRRVIGAAISNSAMGACLVARDKNLVADKSILGSMLVIKRSRDDRATAETG